jgi:hypothetical protein
MLRSFGGECLSANRKTFISRQPASIDEMTIPDVSAERVRNLFERNNQRFIVLPNLSQYPRDCLFDTNRHLVEECRIEYLNSLGRELTSYLG